MRLLRIDPAVGVGEAFPVIGAAPDVHVLELADDHLATVRTAHAHPAIAAENLVPAVAVPPPVGAVVLRPAERPHVVGRVPADPVVLGRVHPQRPLDPVRAVVRGVIDAAVVGQDHLAIGRREHEVVVDVHAGGHHRPVGAAVGRAIRADAARVHDVRVDRVDADDVVVPALAAAVARPRAAGDRPVVAGVHARVDRATGDIHPGNHDVRIRAMHVQGDSPAVAPRREAVVQPGPRGALIGGAVDPAVGAAPDGAVDPVGVVRAEQHVGRGRPHRQPRCVDQREGRSGVGAQVAAVVARGVDPVRIGFVDGQPADGRGELVALGPGQAAVRRFEHPDSRVVVARRVPLPGAEVDDVRVGRIEDHRAAGQCGLEVRQGLPGRSAITGAPDASVGGRCVERVRRPGGAVEPGHPAGDAERADRDPHSRRRDPAGHVHVLAAAAAAETLRRVGDRAGRWLQRIAPLGTGGPGAQALLPPVQEIGDRLPCALLVTQHAQPFPAPVLRDRPVERIQAPAKEPVLAHDPLVRLPVGDQLDQPAEGGVHRVHLGLGQRRPQPELLALADRAALHVVARLDLASGQTRSRRDDPGLGRPRIG